MGEIIEVILDDEGRLVLPSPLRRKLGLSEGMSLVVERETEDAAYLRVRDEPSLTDEDGVLVVRSRPLGDLGNVARNERSGRSSLRGEPRGVS